MNKKIRSLLLAGSFFLGGARVPAGVTVDGLPVGGLPR